MRWTIAALREPVFELAEAAFFAMYGDAERLPLENIKNWVNRGFLSPIMGKRGKKNVRLYTATDLLKIFVASALIRQHTSLESSFICGELLVERLLSQIENGSFVTEPKDEHWIVFTDEGGTSREYSGNTKINFHIMLSFTNERGSFPPVFAEITGDHPWVTKQETFNADRLIAKFLREFYKFSANTVFKSRVVSSFYIEPTTKFEKDLTNYLGLSRPAKQPRKPKGKA